MKPYTSNHNPFWLPALWQLPLLLVAGLLASGLIMAGCSGQDPVPLTDPDPRPILLGYDYNVELFSSDQDPQGRSVTLNVSDSADPTTPTTAGVFGAMDGYDHPIFDDQKFYHLDDQPYTDEYVASGHDWSMYSNDWPYFPVMAWTIGKDYDFYCYTPHTTYDNTSVDMSYIRFGEMEKFTHSKIPPFSNVAYTVSKSVKPVDTQDEDFDGVVHFSMTHLSARICMCMTIGEQYSRIRDIRVKKVTINDRSSDASFYKWEVDLTKNPSIFSLSPDGNYTPASSSEVNILPIFNDTEGLLLDPTKYEQFGSLYTMPQRVETLQMNVTYDVYDKEGMLIRQDQQISNQVAFGTDVVQGHYYNIKIVVSPAFLYVLSDNDVAPDLVLDVNL